MSSERFDPRPYFTLTNEYPRHRKIRALSDKAFRLHVSLIALANDERNDGNLLPIDVDMLGPRPRNELVNAGLLNKTADGYQLHDYLRHQKSAAEINELSTKRRTSGSSGGKKSHHVRNHANKNVHDPECDYCNPQPAEPEQGPPDLDSPGEPPF